MRKIGFVGRRQHGGRACQGLARDEALSGPRAVGERCRARAARPLHARARRRTRARQPRRSSPRARSSCSPVKPQVMQAVLAEIRPQVTRRHLFVSIAAGIPTRAARRRPRTAESASCAPCRTRRRSSVTGSPSWCAARMRPSPTSGARPSSSVESAKWSVLRTRALMDAVTGLSGSGPAYVYRFAEGLIAGAVAEGLGEAVARQLTYQTLRGAAVMLQETGRSPEDLRAMVSSPGGHDARRARRARRARVRGRGRRRGCGGDAPRSRARPRLRRKGPCS